MNPHSSLEQFQWGFVCTEASNLPKQNSEWPRRLSTETLKIQHTCNGQGLWAQRQRNTKHLAWPRRLRKETVEMQYTFFCFLFQGTASVLKSTQMIESSLYGSPNHSGDRTHINWGFSTPFLCLSSLREVLVLQVVLHSDFLLCQYWAVLLLLLALVRF